MKITGNLVLDNLQQRAEFLDDIGTVDAYAVSFMPPLEVGYTRGLGVTFMAANDNTGPCTLEVDGYGPVRIVKDVIQDLGVGDILAGEIVKVIHDGTYFQMIATPQVAFSPFFSFLIDGGQIVWVANLDYNVSAANYVILGLNHASPLTPITLAAADLTYNRIDLVVVDSNNTVQVITGTASANPQEPSYDPATQLPLAFITVEANTTEPACSLIVPVYREALGTPTEWTTTSSSGTMVVNSTSTPRSGTKDIEGTAVPSGQFITFIAPSPVDFSTVSQIDFYIRSKGSWGTIANGHRFSVTLLNGITQLGNPVIIPPSGAFGFNSSTTGIYQQIAINTGLFNIPDGSLITSMKLTVSGTDGSMGWFMDDVSLETTCVVQTPLNPLTFNNGLTQTGNVVQLGGQLLHNTTNYTAGFIHTLQGATVFNYPYQFSQLQAFQNATSIASFLSGGSNLGGQPDVANLVKLGINYTGAVYSTGPTNPGYLGDKIGYWIGTNVRGHGSFAMDVDNNNSKISGLLFHTLDTSYTDAISFFAKHPPIGSLAITFGGNALAPYILSTLHDTGQWSHWKYGVGTFADTPAFAIGVTSSGDMIEFTPAIGAPDRFGVAGEDPTSGESRNFDINGNPFELTNTPSTTSPLFQFNSSSVLQSTYLSSIQDNGGNFVAADITFSTDTSIPGSEYSTADIRATKYNATFGTPTRIFLDGLQEQIAFTAPSGGFVFNTSSGIYTFLNVPPATALDILYYDPITGAVTYGAPSTGGILTADNGLNLSTATNVQLGGALLQDTTISGNFSLIVHTGSASFSLEAINTFGGNAIEASTSTGIAVNASSSGGGMAVQGTATGAIGVNGITDTLTGVQGLATISGTGVFGESALGNGVWGKSDTEANAGVLANTVSATDAIIFPSLEIFGQYGAGGTSSGFGTSIIFNLNASSGAKLLSNEIKSLWIDPTDGAQVSQLQLTGVDLTIDPNPIVIAYFAVQQAIIGAANTTDNTEVNLSPNVLSIRAESGGGTNQMFQIFDAATNIIDIINYQAGASVSDVIPTMTIQSDAAGPITDGFGMSIALWSAKSQSVGPTNTLVSKWTSVSTQTSEFDIIGISGGSPATIANLSVPSSYITTTDGTIMSIGDGGNFQLGSSTMEVSGNPTAMTIGNPLGTQFFIREGTDHEIFGYVNGNIGLLLGVHSGPDTGIFSIGDYSGAGNSNAIILIDGSSTAFFRIAGYSGASNGNVLRLADNTTGQVNWTALGIDDILAVGQNFTADRTINITGHSLLIQGTNPIINITDNASSNLISFYTQDGSDSNYWSALSLNADKTSQNNTTLGLTATANTVTLGFNVFPRYVEINNGGSNFLRLSYTTTPANSTDNVLPNESLCADDTYLYYRTSGGTWVKMPWQTF